MNITTMTKEELITLKKDITKELNHRIKKDYDDRATNHIKGLFYYTDEYIEPYE